MNHPSERDKKLSIKRNLIETVTDSKQSSEPIGVVHRSIEIGDHRPYGEIRKRVSSLRSRVVPYGNRILRRGLGESGNAHVEKPEIKEGEYASGVNKAVEPVTPKIKPMDSQEGPVAYSRFQRVFYTPSITSQERSLRDYLHLSGLNLAQLRETPVVDVGAGLRLLFAKEASREGVKVASINPTLIYDHVRLLTGLDHPHLHANEGEESGRQIKVPALAGIGQFLPLADGVSKTVFDIGAATAYLEPDKRSYIRYYDELRRITAPGAQITIVYWPDINRGQDALIESEMHRFEYDGYRVAGYSTVLEDTKARVFRIKKPDDIF